MSDTEAATATDVPASPAAEDTRPGYSPYKLGWGLGTVMVLASLALFLAFISLWANRQLLDSDQWTETSTEVIQQPAVRTALANYLVDQLFTSVDVEQELKDQLPKDWDVLASPATSGLRSLALSGTKSALDLPVVQAAWKEANQLSHEQLITILEGGNENVSTTNGTVTINARSILTDVANKVGLSGELANKIPASAATITIYQSSDLAAVQNAYTVVKDLRWIFAGLALVLYVLAIALAKGRRRRAVIWMGTSFIVVALLVLITSSLARTPVVDSLAQTSAVVPAVTDVYNIAVELLRRMAGSLLFTGILVLLAAMVAGPYTWAITVRRFLAPYFRDYLALSIATALLLFLIVLWLVPVNGFRTAVGLTINIALAIAGFIALVRITRHEFPDAEQADFGAAGDWVKKQWGGATGFVKQQASKTDLPSFRGGGEKTTEVAVKPVGDTDELERLSTLHKSGSLTDEEYAAAKKKLLG
ncbi:MAG: SHOCT domain-containing protein [Thermoleophilaceae bacterium]|nr:SHOCT domain-containing protein [Thermoleophilaceae bacterium]